MAKDPKLAVSLLFAHILGFLGLAQISYEEAFPNLGFDFAVEIQNANDGSNRLFVVEQPGLIKVFPNTPNIGPSEVSSFLDIQSRVSYNPGQEIGLLGLAFHPNFQNNRFFYVYYTDDSNGFRMVLSRFEVSAGNPNFVDPNTERVLFRFQKNQPESNHNGGKIAFGPDGYLYISIGDGGGGGDPLRNGQNLNTAFGSILRIDVDVDGNNPIENNPEEPNGNYEIPSDNPRLGQSGLDELYAWGIRNTWKFSFDGNTLIGADVGQEDTEEINIIENGGNYGWNRFEGNDFEDNTSPLVTEPDIKPLFTYPHTEGNLSITGGYVYRGGIQNPSLQGKYIYGDFISGRVWALTYDINSGTASSEFLFRTNGELISSFGLDESGELYFLNYGFGTKLYKITDGSSDPVTTPVNGVGNWINSGLLGVNGTVQTIVNDGNDRFFVGGEFTSASGASVSNLATYSKTEGWVPFSSGTNGKVNAVAIDNSGNVFVGGDFTTINGQNVSNIAFWNGSTWSNMNGGTNGPISKIGIDDNGNVYVGGTFETAGGITVNNIALWQNGAWSALQDSGTGSVGTNNEIRSIAFDENNVLYVGGNFDNAGGNGASRIASWNGSNWSTLGSGTSGFVQAILVRPDYIYAGGNFSVAGNAPANRIARWNRNTSAWETLDFGLSGNVNTMTHDGNFLYVGGSFETASDEANINKIVNNVARWSENGGWEALGPNTNVGINSVTNALAFTNDNSQLLTAGSFNTAGAIAADNIAFWGNSVQCSDESITPEFNINGNVQSGSNILNITAGANLILGIQQNIFYTITLPDGSTINGIYDFGTVDTNDSGTYRISTTEGCSETVTIGVVQNPNGDQDNDGVNNLSDLCPDTPAGETVDSNGCSESQLDDDNDGVSNADDICPDTPANEEVDAQGCSNAQRDDDNDGVLNPDDSCPNTPPGEAVDAQGCGNSQLDDDGDGVLNPADLCPNTPDGQSVDSNGCASSQLDDDNDGVSNADDICPETPANEAVDAQGCSDAQRDDDGDGVLNPNDSCPNTPSGEAVDVNGCGQSQLDDDNDGVSNADDLCPGTPAGETADSTGCGTSQQDLDGDGVSNANDLCENTPAGETVDADGCSQSQLDDDGDGVVNSLDRCPNTSPGSQVDGDGCVVSPISNENFNITSTGTTCRGLNNGQIVITAQAILSYTARLTSTSFSETINFSNSLIVNNLPAGTFDLCITVAEFPDYESCFTVIVDTPQPLSVFSNVDEENALVNLTMLGAEYYVINLNGDSFETTSEELQLALKNGVNTLQIKTDQDCQGIFEETIFVTSEMVLFPNPVRDVFYIDTRNVGNLPIQLNFYSLSGQLVKKSEITTNTSQIEINARDLPSGVYAVEVIDGASIQTLKLIKL